MAMASDLTCNLTDDISSHDSELLKLLCSAVVDPQFAEDPLSDMHHILVM